MATIYSSSSTTSPFQALIMLYDNALFSLRAIKAAIAAEDKAAQAMFVQRAEEIVQAINGCIDSRSTDMAADLKTLYGYVLNELSQASKDRSPRRIERCEIVLKELRKVWVNMEVARNSSLPLAA